MQPTYSNYSNLFFLLFFKVKMLDLCGKTSSFKAITWHAFVNGEKQTDFEDMNNKQFFVDKFYGYGSDRVNGPFLLFE